MTAVESPVSGNIWQILVAVGDSVKAGEELIVIESMKMEVPVDAPHDGTVAVLVVEVGQAVVQGEYLVTID